MMPHRRVPAGIVNSPEPLMTVEKVALELQVHPFTVYRWAKSGELPFMFKVGGRWRCRREDLNNMGRVPDA